MHKIARSISCNRQATRALAGNKMYPTPPQHYHGGYSSGMNHMVNQFSEMNMSTRSGGRGRGPSVPRYPGVRMYRDDYRRDRPDDRRSNRYNNDDEGGDNYGGNSYGGGNDYYNSGPRGGYNGGGGGGGGGRGRGGMYQNMPQHGGGRGGYYPRNKFQPPNMGGAGGEFSPYQGNMRRGNSRGDFQGGNDWRGGFGEQVERDDFYPDRVSTHILNSSERYQKDWSIMAPRDVAMENKLFKKQFVQVEINFDNWKNIPVETSGTNLPEPISTFKDIGLGEILENNIKLAGILQPTPVQMYSTSIVKNGRDLMACAQTGSGKTAAFLIPILSNLFENGPPQELKDGTSMAHRVSPLVLILAPTRELASQIFEMTQHLCYRSCVRPYVVYGGSNIDKCIDQLSLGVEILVATPGRLIDLLNRGEVNLSMVKFLVLDEADRMLDMGFEKDIRTIVTDYKMGIAGKRQTLMFSATFPKPIQLLAKEFMDDYIFLTVGRIGSTNDIITQKLNYVRRNDKIPELLRVLTEETKDRILVFVRTKHDTEKIQGVLKDEGHSVISIHGNKSQRMRENALNQFRNGDKNVLVATEVAARGLDIPNISHVVNFDMPDTIENYVHRIGRTGRMGNPGRATSFFCESDWHIAPELAELLKESSQEVPQFLAKMKYNNSTVSGGSGGGHKKSFTQDRFGGRDYRRGPQFSTNVRYSNTMKPPGGGTIRSYSTNPPNFYNQMHPFNHMGYAAQPYMQSPNSYNPTGNYNNRDNNAVGNTGNPGNNNQSAADRLTPAGGNAASSGGQQAQHAGNQGNQPLLPPPLINTQQAQQQPQNYLPAFNQMGGSGNEGIAVDGLNSSPVPNPSTPAPAPFPLYASSNAAALYNSQFNTPASFSPRNFQANAAQFGVGQQELSDNLANPQAAGLVRPFIMQGVTNLPAGLTNIPGMATSWAAWTQDTAQ
ncbi:uncharacterized protein LOC134825579 isoform X3 [Bolinopsis microptera]|uniref:uncharacterized protein LOC134825579 isoform X3 n=1 Tax=Bolinopsis microptera TaxID=2820187 RepID=UPI00307AAEAF